MYLSRTLVGGLLASALAFVPAGCGTQTVVPDEPGKGAGGGCGADTYPCGPYGYVSGEVIENLEMLGRIDVNDNADITDDPPVKIGLADFFREKDIKVLALLVSAEWCPPCKQEQPELVETWNDFKARKQGVAYLEAMIQKNDGTPADLATLDRWAKAYGIPFPMVIDPSNVLGPYYNISAFPMEMVIRTSDMSIQAQANGYRRGWLATQIENQLAGE